METAFIEHFGQLLMYYLHPVAPLNFSKAFGLLGSASVAVDEHMTPRMGTLVSLSAGSLVGVIASFVSMIFGPLAFPQAIGFFIARKLIARFIAHGTDTNRTFT
jgi:hypothetical protein